MWKVMVPVALCGLLSVSQPPSQHPLAGDWEGTYTTSESQGKLWVRIAKTDGQWSVAVKATSAYVVEPAFQAASSVKVDGAAISFVAQWGTPIEFKGALKEDVLGGDIAAEHWSGRWSVRRAQ